MRHILMTCENHRDLRWNCKSIAVTDSGRYNQSRNIFFRGRAMADGSIQEIVTLESGERMVIRECSCPGSALIAVNLADVQRAREEE